MDQPARRFYLRLARRLGYPSVRHLMASGVTSTELVEMAALEMLEPGIEDRIDIGFAQVMSLIYNRTRGKSERPRRPRDFMPRWGPPDDRAMESELRSGLAMIREARKNG